ncbi:glycosyltransferase family 4 protein [Microbacterium sp. CFH 90308]|uniref:D-inositol 3-phosphate glycosyltransferase n=1 Tax=Microbacterium salsuginis TaxID=2722803 RepID=A0ABX1KCT2_9MICO|nr:glycosyltransferase [Microbacterium sp. CFH 90308]NLP84838.1 glycosyltransferase family 4 protein [Microbacterium sp. CFH 90308]
MHIVIFADQHAEALGGAQVTVRLQRRFLERAGHTVSVVAPRRYGPRRRVNGDDPAYLDLPGIPLTPDREYSLTWPGRHADDAVDRALLNRPAADLVHVQGEFWGAFLGYRFAARRGLPVVHTMHSRIDAGLEATTPFPHLIVRGLNGWRRRALRGLRGAADTGVDAWAYLRALARGATAVTAPSGHYARRLEANGVFDHVDVIWNGIDDDALDRVAGRRPAGRRPGPVRLVWLGRLSPEKRPLPFLEAVAEAVSENDLDCEVEVIGGGVQLAAANRLAERRGIAARVRFTGTLPYEEALKRMADADALVQTSIGFETQGMTVFEAACFGTPAILCDPDIAREVGAGHWLVGQRTDEAARIQALARTLRRAGGDIEEGIAPRPDPVLTSRFRQSASTAAMIDVYRRATS